MQNRERDSRGARVEVAEPSQLTEEQPLPAKRERRNGNIAFG
jgi:hypothetical protein